MALSADRIKAESEKTPEHWASVIEDVITDSVEAIGLDRAIPIVRKAFSELVDTGCRVDQVS